MTIINSKIVGHYGKIADTLTSIQIYRVVQKVIPQF